MIYKYIMSVNKVFVDTRKFAIDRDFKNAISTLTLFQDFYKKKRIFKIDEINTSESLMMLINLLGIILI